MVDVRAAAPQDAEAAIGSLVDAFFTDPLSVWIAPDEETRRSFHRGIFRAAFEDSLAGGALQVAVDEEEVTGVGVWYPPGRAANPGGQGLEAARRALSEADVERLAALREAMAEHHPDAPHYYLWLLGVHHSRRGAGIGSAMLTSTLGTADRESQPAYLEATAANNRRLYERHGFEVVGEIRLPDGPTLWPMWRAPPATG